MSTIFLYAHGGSKNHGCEAIVRSTVKILEDSLSLFSMDIAEDAGYKLDHVCRVLKNKIILEKSNPLYVVAYLEKKLVNSRRIANYLENYHYYKNVKTGDIALSIGGDNYCYDKGRFLLEYNNLLRTLGAKTVLLGCSIEPDDIDEIMIKDLNTYSLIIARESITFAALKKIHGNVVLYPDPAFQLNCQLPERIANDLGSKDDILGINLSPLIIKSETNQGVTLENYKLLIRHVIENTTMKIALIPHVIKEDNDDRVPLRELYNSFAHSGRLLLINDYDCMTLKGVIAKCRFFIGARTHATIAAYATCVPTLVVGYSVKAKGIAKDIFGTDENYVIPVQSLKHEADLTHAFEWIMSQEEAIRNHLRNFMPGYCAKALGIKAEIQKLMDK